MVMTSEKDKSKLSKLEIDLNHLKSDTTRLYVAQREADKRLVNIASNFLYIPYEAYSIEKIAIPAFKAIVNDRLRHEHHIKYELLCNYRKDIESILSFIEFVGNKLQKPFVKDANEFLLQFHNQPFYQSYQNYPEWSDTYLGGKISLIDKQLKEFDGNQHKVDFTALKEEYLAAKAAVNELSNKYANGELDDAAFEREMAQYNEILKREEIIEQIFSRYEYAAADPEKRMLIPAGSVPVLSDTSVNFLFLLCITFCCAYAVMIEYSGKSRYILITTKGGQKATMAAKLAILLLLTSLTSIIISCFDLVRLSDELPLEYWGYSLCSVPAFDNTAVDISIIGAFLSAQLLKLIGYLFICVAAMLTAHFTKNYVASVFPFIAVPVVADYLAERDSQALFLPTGLLKGAGYFLGDKADKGYATEADTVIYFHHVPPLYTVIMTAAVVLFIVIGAVILIKSGENRLNSKRHGVKHIPKAVVLTLALLFCTACGSTRQAECVDVLSNTENSRYSFELKYEDEKELIAVTDKSSGESFIIPEETFVDESYSIMSIYPTENYLYYMKGRNSGVSIYRIKLSDMTREEIIKSSDTADKSILGLTFSWSDTENRFSAVRLFTDEKNIYLIDKNGMVFVLNPFAEKITDCTCIIEESVLGGCIFDGKAIYYIDEDGVQKMYNVVNKTFRI